MGITLRQREILPIVNFAGLSGEDARFLVRGLPHQLLMLEINAVLNFAAGTTYLDGGVVTHDFITRLIERIEVETIGKFGQRRVRSLNAEFLSRFWEYAQKTDINIDNGNIMVDPESPAIINAAKPYRMLLPIPLNLVDHAYSPLTLLETSESQGVDSVVVRVRLAADLTHIFAAPVPALVSATARIFTDEVEDQGGRFMRTFMERIVQPVTVANTALRTSIRRGHSLIKVYIEAYRNDLPSDALINSVQLVTDATARKIMTPARFHEQSNRVNGVERLRTGFYELSIDELSDGSRQLPTLNFDIVDLLFDVNAPVGLVNNIIITPVELSGVTE